MSIFTPVSNKFNTWLDSRMRSRGFIKASEIEMPNLIFRGEIMSGDEMNLYADLSGEQFERLAITNYAVYRNIMELSRIIAQATYYVQERDASSEAAGTEGWKIIYDHEYSNIIEYVPNPYMGQFFIWMYQIAWLLLHGESYWLMVKDGTGSLREIYPLPANRIKPMPHPTEVFRGFAYNPISGGTPTLIEPDRILFMRFPNLYRYHRGMAPISAFLLGLQTSHEAQRTDYEDYTNRLNLQQLISIKSDATRQEFNTALADLQEAQQLRRRYKLIRAGQMDVKDTGQKRGPDSDLIYKITDRQADAIFGFPAAYWTEHPTEASYRAAKGTLIENVAYPLGQMLAEDQTTQVIRRYYGENYRVAFEDIRPVNREIILREKESRIKRQTYNEARMEEGLDEHPDPDIGNAPAISAGRIAEIKVTAGVSLALAQTQNGEALKHVPIVENMKCPFCKTAPVHRYLADNGLCFCPNCQQTFDAKYWGVEPVNGNGHLEREAV